MAKPRAWMDGQMGEDPVPNRESELRKLWLAVLAFIQSRPEDFPHISTLIQRNISNVLEKGDKLHELAEQWHYQNLYSMLESLAEKVGQQDGAVAQELFWAFQKILGSPKGER